AALRRRACHSIWTRSNGRCLPSLTGSSYLLSPPTLRSMAHASCPDRFRAESAAGCSRGFAASLRAEVGVLAAVPRTEAGRHLRRQRTVEGMAERWPAAGMEDDGPWHWLLQCIGRRR